MFTEEEQALAELEKLREETKSIKLNGDPKHGPTKKMEEVTEEDLENDIRSPRDSSKHSGHGSMIQGSMVMPTRYISETRSERGGFISNPPKGAPRGQLAPKDTGKTSGVATGLHQQANGSSAQPVGNRVP